MGELVTAPREAGASSRPKSLSQPTGRQDGKSGMLRRLNPVEATTASQASG